MIRYRESDDNFNEIKQKYGQMTSEDVEKVLKEDRIKKIKETEKIIKNDNAIIFEAKEFYDKIKKYSDR